MVGYTTQKIHVERDKQTKINIELSAGVEGLDPLVVVGDPKDKTEDPAWGIWRQVIKNKKVNNREKL